MSQVIRINGWRRPATAASAMLLAVALSACVAGSDTPTPTPTPTSSSSVANSSTATSSSVRTSSSVASSSVRSSSSTGSNTSVPADSGVTGRYRVNSEGRVTESGTVFPVKCGNWFGLEGQHEPADAESNPSGAPLELYIGNMWWDNDSKRTIKQTFTELKTLGINMIRLPISPQTLEANNEQGMTRVWNGTEKNPNGRLKNKADAYPYANARAAMEGVIKEAKTAGIKVLVDIHSCSNFVGWRAGKLDSKPPYADANRGADYEFTREDYSCSSEGDAKNKTPYGETKWLADIKKIADLAKTNDNIIGIDIFNEPWDYTWDQWATLSEKAYKTIDAANKDILIFVEGIGSGLQDQSEEIPHGDKESNPNWGENFYGFKARPLQIPRDRIVISPHTYGPSVYVQPQFLSNCGVDSDGKAYEGDEAGKQGCPIDIKGQISKLEKGWEEHFGYLRDMNYALVLGEFGGNMDWPQKGVSASAKETWGHITSTVDRDWQEALSKYMKKEKIEGCYWSINPESADTGGIYKHKYDPVSAKEDWGKWQAMDDRKTSMLKTLWGN